MSTPGVSESEFPAAYIAADKSSLEGQRRFLAATRLRLVSVLGASVCGGLISVDALSRAAAIAAALAFGIAFIAEIYLLRARPERSWYDGRPSAESAKTLTWRLIVGGRPFGMEETSASEAEALFLDRLSKVVDGLKSVSVVRSVPGVGQISSSMREVRSLSLDDRKKQYLETRIKGQRDWYAAKAQENEKLATRWMVALSVLEVVALTGAVLLATETLAFDLLGVSATAVAAGAAWTQTKQFQTLASAYSVASQELAEISSRGLAVQSEADWALFVEQSEEAISREHTTWRASRS